MADLVVSASGFFVYIEESLVDLVPLEIDQDSEPLVGAAAGITFNFDDNRGKIRKSWSCGRIPGDESVGVYQFNLDAVEYMSEVEGYTINYWIDGSFHAECLPDDGGGAEGIVYIDAVF